MGQLGHPYASMVHASVKRRLKALGATAGKSWGRASMDTKSHYPKTHAGTEREMTISGKTAVKRADRYARGGKVKKGGKHVTNVIVAGSHPPPAQDRPLPVPVPVGAGPAAGPIPAPPRPVAPAPPIPVPGPAGGIPPRPPGLRDGGFLSTGEEYHNWGKGYKKGGAVKKSDGGAVRAGDEDGGEKPGKAYPGWPRSPTTEEGAARAVSPTKRGGAVKKRARGGPVHSDVAEDKKLVNKMLAEHEKKEMKVEGKLKHRAAGGTVHGGVMEEYHDWGKGKRKHGGAVFKAGSGTGYSRMRRNKEAARIPAKTEL